MQRSFSAAVGAALLVICLDALAVAQRTFVSTGGSDANTTLNCSLVAPCRSFGSALTVTATDGEIVVLDSGGYGRVTIDKSVALIAPAGVYAGISVFAGENGVDVAGAVISVVLRGLTINGQGGDIGIQFTQGSRLYIEQCTISNMGLHGIELLTGETYVSDTTIRDNAGNGIRTEGSLQLTVDGTRIERNGSTGMRVLNGPTVSVTRSVIAGNLGSVSGGFDIESADPSLTHVTISESSVSQNIGHGVFARTSGAGSNVRLVLSRNTFSRNTLDGVRVFTGTGLLRGVITDNAIVRNGNGGISAAGAGVIVTIANNAVWNHAVFGVRQLTSALLKTRANNVIQDNLTDVSGTLTFVAGD